ncbi:MAG: MurR/RpiR family transcriptional regulator [Oscillospiraceae bacterium]|nr:MurR/RpiR family transcriptional regulator [Oscillospiraceae bacterium]MCD8374520.1 MurR/RpiR family transcriptional regulator [Oscillospiraceae bacterium]
MEKDIMALLSHNEKQFSKGQRKIARYISEYYDKAAFMTAGKLGKTVGVSESTVVRFAAELGYDGYPDMRKALQEIIRSRLTSVQRIEAANEYMNQDNILSSVLCSDIEKLRTTLDECDQVAFNAAVDAIVSANSVYIVGMRSSTCLASFMGLYLNLLLDNVHIIQDTAASEIYEQIIRIKPGDVFIGISYPRYSSRTAKAMRFARDAGAKVIGITDGQGSPFVELADILIFAKSDMVSFLDSLVAPLSMINALIVAVGVRTKENISDTFKRLETIWADLAVYENAEEHSDG